MLIWKIFTAAPFLFLHINENFDALGPRSAYSIAINAYSSSHLPFLFRIQGPDAPFAQAEEQGGVEAQESEEVRTSIADTQETQGTKGGTPRHDCRPNPSHIQAKYSKDCSPDRQEF